MKCLVVMAHPVDNSLCGYLTARVIEHLRDAGHEVVLKNLYADAFEPRLSKAERLSYYAREFNAEKLVADIEQLQAAEMLVLVFPTWWFGFPAMLKGWFDRVWAPGYAYKHAVDNGAIVPHLSGLKHLYVVTTLGSAWWVDWLVVWRPISRILRFAIVGTCAKNCKLKVMSLYGCENLDERRVERFVDRVKKTIG
ncbi:MAG: NAD(P)H-dependent oxidoreductase [Alphaproteobacteria bacterium]|nr:NAD(P)H-dependent oxidoreductase [Alphaproteobacteria bacterium]